jgi:hypothetical protein
MRDLIVPIIWINESAVIDSVTQKQLKLPINMVLYSYIGGWIFSLIGSFCFSLIIGSIIVRQCRRMVSVFFNFILVF